ncbi:MAG: hydroxymethylbilane synthase [Methanophagales archaeon]|nr:hydroxymethylbilane synthase [Methanophagales archaeon]
MIIGTRGSKLAILQTEKVCERLKELELGYECTIKTVSSLGDVITNRALYDMPSEGVFVKRLDMLLLAGKIDIAVHSMKDIPLERDEKLETSAVLPRDSPFDVLVSRYRLDDMPDGAVIGTSSVRRRFQFLNYAREKGVKVAIKDIRGNVDTRIKKFRRGEYDGVILAEAGLARLAMGIEYERLDRNPFVPSPGQGIIAVVARKGSEESDILKEMDDAETRVEAEVEREVLKVIGGGCSLPVGVHACCKGEEVELAVYIGPSFERYILEKVVLSRDYYLEEARDFISRVLVDLDHWSRHY